MILSSIKKPKVYHLKIVFSPITADYSLSLTIKWYRNSNLCLIFKGSFLRQDKATFTPSNVVTFLLSMN